MKRYTLTVTRPVEAAEVREDADGAWVRAADAWEMEKRLLRVETILIWALHGCETADAYHAELRKALDVLRGHVPPDNMARARGLLGGAFVGPTGELREKIGMALEALEGRHGQS